MASSAQDAVVAKYTSSGSYVWAQHFGSMTTGSDVFNDASVDPTTSMVAMTGVNAGTNANFGAGTLSSAGGNDIFLLTLAP